MSQFHLDFKGQVDDITDFERTRISTILTRFLKKFSERETFLKIHFKKGKKQFRKKAEYFCKIHLNIQQGRFHSEEKGWGAEHAVLNTVEQLKKQITKKQDKLRRRKATKE